jgi:hypothetical protein
MKRTTGLSLLAGVLFACMSMSNSPQAAPASVNICKSAAVTQCSSIVSDVRLRRRCHCWWRWGRRHCRCWWR